MPKTAHQVNEVLIVTVINGTILAVGLSIADGGSPAGRIDGTYMLAGVGPAPAYEPTMLQLNPDGTIPVTPAEFSAQVPNSVLAGPASGVISAVPTFRYIVAADVPFTQSGTGAVARIMQDKVRETISIIDFGGDPTGVADSGVALQRAHDSLSSGGKIVVPPGTYLISTAVVFTKDNVVLEGLGSTTVAYLNFSRATGIGLDIQGSYNWIIGLHLQASAVGNTLDVCRFVNSFHAGAERTTFSGSGANGLRVFGGQDCGFYQCIFTSNVNGCYIDGSAGHTNGRVIWRDCTFNLNTGWGLTGTPNDCDCILDHSGFVTNSIGSIGITGSQCFFMIDHCEIEQDIRPSNAQNAAIYFTDTSIENGPIITNNTITYTAGDGLSNKSIYLEYQRGATVTENRFFGDTQTNRICIYIGANCQDCQVDSNYHTSVLAGGTFISDNSTTTLKFSNRGTDGLVNVLNGPMLLPDGTTAAPSFAFRNSVGSGWSLDSAVGVIQATYGATRAFAVSATGPVVRDAFSLSWGSSVFATPDVGLSRLGAAIIGLGNGTASNFSGTLKLTTLNAVTAIQLNGTSINTAGTLSNVAYLNQANSFSANQTLGSSNVLLWSTDVSVRRSAAASLLLGAANSATPVSYTLTGGESSRGGTDSNVAGGSFTIASGLGTGTGAVSSLIFQTPTVAASGTTAQALATRLTLSSTSALFATSIQSAVAGALSTGAGPAVALTGTWITGGSATTTKPYFLIEPAGTTSTGWLTNGTGLGINAPSGFTGAILDAQINGVSKFYINPSGSVVRISGYDLLMNGGSIKSDSGGLQIMVTSNNQLQFGTNNTVALVVDTSQNLAVGKVANATPVAHSLAVGESSRSGTDSNVGGANGTVASGTGTGTGTLATLILQSPVAVGSGTGVQTLTTGLTIKAGTAVLTNYTVANLPAAATAGTGATAFVTDSTATVITGLGLAVVGGGSNKVPVYSDGTNWLVG